VLPASVSKKDELIAIYGFSDDAVLPSAPVPNILGKSSLKEGQSVLSIGADGRVITGIVTQIGKFIHTSFGSVELGTAAVSSSGNIIGIAINGLGDFAGAERINALLSATSTSAQ
jgi:hypothetical protein